MVIMKNKSWNMKRTFQIDFLKRVGLKPSHYFLDLGCGPLRGGIPLIDYLDTGHYFGVEIREGYLNSGLKELKAKGLDNKKPCLMVGDASTALLPRKMDYIWAYSVLIHMEDSILNDTLGFVRDNLKDDGCFYANVNVGNIPDRSWKGFPVVFRSKNFYDQACKHNGLNIKDMGPVSEWGHNIGIHLQDTQRMLKIMAE
jgi:SAM-dependent methyltransferase